MADTLHPNEEYNRFEEEMAKAEKKGEKSIGRVLAKGLRSVDRNAEETKKMMYRRAAEALARVVGDTHSVSARLTRMLPDKGRHIRRSLPDEYKSPKYQAIARMRNKAPSVPLDNHADLGPLTYDRRPLPSDIHNSRNKITPPGAPAELPPIVYHSSDGGLGGQVPALEDFVPLWSGKDAPLQADTKFIEDHSGMLIIEAVIPKTEVDRIATFRTWSSGYRILERSIEYTDFITITPQV